MVVLSRIFIAEPSVIEQEHIYAEVLCLLHQTCERFLIEVKASVLPVVEQREAAAPAILQTVVARPFLQVSAALRRTLIAQCEDKLWRCECLAGLKLIVRRRIINSWKHTQVADVIYFEGKTEVARPSERSHQHPTRLLLHLSIESYLEERMSVHGRTTAQLGLNHLLAELQLLAAHAGLFCPVAAELGEIVCRLVKI